jgi:hypothetical protein
LIYPIFQASTMALLPLAVLAALFLRVPTPIAMLSMLPLYLALFICVIQGVALFEFARIHNLARPWRQALALPLIYMPYNWILGVAAVRAFARQMRGVRNWEKTPHTGVLRNPPFPLPEPFEEAPVAAGGGRVAVGVQIALGTMTSVQLEEATSIDA